MNAYNQDSGVSKRPVSCKFYAMIFLILCGIGVGMYFLIQASRDPQSREISRLDSTLAA